MQKRHNPQSSTQQMCQLLIALFFSSQNKFPWKKSEKFVAKRNDLNGRR